MANNRLVWYLLVDKEGHAYNGTTASKVRIPSHFVIDQFRDAMKKKCDDQGDDLKGILGSKLLVYENEQAREDGNALKMDDKVGGLGQAPANALLVVVPTTASQEEDARVAAEKAKDLSQINWSHAPLFSACCKR